MISTAAPLGFAIWTACSSASSLPTEKSVATRIFFAVRVSMPETGCKRRTSAEARVSKDVLASQRRRCAALCTARKNCADGPATSRLRGAGASELDDALIPRVRAFEPQPDLERPPRRED